MGFARTTNSNFLEDDGITLGSLGGIEDNTDEEDRSILSDLAEKLVKPHTVRLFAAPSGRTR